MQHARLIEMEVRRCSEQPDPNQGEFLEEEAVQELLEQGHDSVGDSDAITGIGRGLVLGAVVWIIMVSAIALAF